jgi:uncharacterized membrane protein
MIRGFCSIVFQRETLRPVLALAAVSAIAMGLVGTRMLLSQSLKHGYLVWNLFLAWLPLFFCLASVRTLRSHSARHWKFWALATAWLLFLPNAPYIFTDLTHLGPRNRGHFWVDLVLIVMTAWTASLIGFLSLYIMQTLVSRRYGWVTGWGFAVFVSGLVGLGIYIGRFLRWNSWGRAGQSAWHRQRHTNVADAIHRGQKAHHLSHAVCAALLCRARDARRPAAPAPRAEE